MFTSDNTEGFTSAQLAAMNAEYQSDMQSVLAGFPDGINDDLISQIQQSVSEAVLKRHGGAADQKRFGTVEFEGVNYALIEQAQLTSRTFPGSWHDASEGDEYQAEYGAQAVDASGNDFFVTWQFTETKGAETDDVSNYDWSTVFHVVAR